MTETKHMIFGGTHIGMKLGHYVIDGMIGKGGMGTVYSGYNINLSKLRVAIKILNRQAIHDATLIHRFKREAELLAELCHPNCVHIHHYENVSASLFLVVDLIEGMDLLELINDHCARKTQINTLLVIKIMKEICLALDAAHKLGIVHRDLKPENIRLQNLPRDPYFVRVIDFGIAKLVANEEDDGGGFKTKAGLVCGTPEYMSPEMICAQTIDGRTDLYSLGTILYQMLTFRLPFPGDTPFAIATRKTTEDFPEIPPYEAILINPQLIELVYALSSKDPNERPRTAYDVYQVLESIERTVLITQPVVTTPDHEVQTLLARINAPRKIPMARLDALDSDVIDSDQFPIVSTPVQPIKLPRPAHDVVYEKFPVANVDKSTPEFTNPPRTIPLWAWFTGILALSITGALAFFSTTERPPEIQSGGAPIASIGPLPRERANDETSRARIPIETDIKLHTEVVPIQVIPETTIDPQSEEPTTSIPRQSIETAYVVKSEKPVLTPTQELALAQKLVLNKSTHARGCIKFTKLFNGPLSAKAQREFKFYCN